eukprot:53843_1
MVMNECSHSHIGEDEAEGGPPEHPCCTKDRMEREWKEFKMSKLRAADPVRKAEAARRVMTHFPPDIDSNPGHLSTETLAVRTYSGSGIDDVDDDDDSELYSEIDDLQLKSFECEMKELTHLGKHGYGVVVDCKDELELKEALLHQQPVMVFIHDEEAQQLNSAMKQRLRGLSRTWLGSRFICIRGPLDSIEPHCSPPALAAYKDNRLITSTPLEGEIARGGEINDVALENWLFHTGSLQREPPDANVKSSARVYCCCLGSIYTLSFQFFTRTHLSFPVMIISHASGFE